MLSEEDDRLAPLPPAFPRTFQNYFLKNGLKKEKREVGKKHKTMMGIPCLSCCTRTKAFCLTEKEKFIYLLQFNPAQA